MSAADLKHESLLWVHHNSFRGMNAKAGSIKVFHTMHEPACSKGQSASLCCKMQNLTSHWLTRLQGLCQSQQSSALQHRRQQMTCQIWIQACVICRSSFYPHPSAPGE